MFKFIRRWIGRILAKLFPGRIKQPETTYPTRVDKLILGSTSRSTSSRSRYGVAHDRLILGGDSAKAKPENDQGNGPES